MNKKQKKILFYLFNFNRGGAEWVVTNLCNEMVENDIYVTMLSVKGGDMVCELDDRVLYEHFNGNYLKSFYSLFKKLLVGKYNVLFTTQRGAGVIAAIIHMLSFSKSKLVLRVAASNIKYTLNTRKIVTRPLWRSLFKFSFKRASIIVTNSLGTQNDLVNNRMLCKNNVTHINNPVDIKKIIKKASFRDEYNINFKNYTIIFVGRLFIKKNVDIIIKAFNEAKNKIKNIQLLIVGDGPEKQNLEKIVIELGLYEYIKFTGKVDNPYPLIKKSDLLVLASKWEGFGMVLVEALALGVPVIATNIDSGPREILDNGKYGDLVPVDSVEILAESIIKNYKKQHNKKALINRAYEYDTSIITNKYIKVMFENA